LLFIASPTVESEVIVDRVFLLRCRCYLEIIPGYGKQEVGSVCCHTVLSLSLLEQAVVNRVSVGFHDCVVNQHLLGD
jgi:hypothetical protein